ncbi:MAG: rhomboid family intramembrane serine protease [Flavobacteriia bacterium]|nr:rhomboid family intramembrane serine protease [Flavobacteriia bacterium]
MFSILNNIPQVTRSLLILNVLMFILTEFLGLQGIDLRSMLAIHAINSPFFEPYQIVSHFFMHGNFMHLFMNMFGLLMFGAFLEKLWGAKRFFIFFFAAAIGSWLVDGTVGFIEIYNLKAELISRGYTSSQLIEIQNIAINGPEQSSDMRVDPTDMDSILSYINACLSSS